MRDLLTDRAFELFCQAIKAEDLGLAADALSRHYPDEPWRGFRGGMPPIDRGIKGVKSIRLPEPLTSRISIDEAIKRRRSAEGFTKEAITLEELATVLYLGVGVTGWTSAYGYLKFPLRAYPSAGGLQPIEAYPVVSRVQGLEPGLYYYDALRHELQLLKRGELSKRLAAIAFDQEIVEQAPVSIVLTAYYARTRWKYWKRALRYALLDAGAAMENIYLAAVGLGLGARAIGAFYDEELCKFLGIDCISELPIVIMLIGRPSVYLAL